MTGSHHGEDLISELVVGEVIALDEEGKDVIRFWCKNRLFVVSEVRSAVFD